MICSNSDVDQIYLFCRSEYRFLLIKDMAIGLLRIPGQGPR